MAQTDAPKLVVLFLAMILALGGIAFGAVGCSRNPGDGGSGYGWMIVVCGVIIFACFDPLRSVFGFKDDE